MIPVHVKVKAPERTCSCALAYSVRDPILKLLVADGIGGNGLRIAFHHFTEKCSAAYSDLRTRVATISKARQARTFWPVGAVGQ